MASISGPGSSPPSAELLKGALEDRALEDSLAKAEQKSKTADTNSKGSPADANKATAQRLASKAITNKAASEAEAVKFRDQLQSVNGEALLSSLQTLGQTTGTQNGSTAGTDAQHQAAMAFGQLEPLMGEPPTGSVKIAEAFSPDAVSTRFQAGFQVGLGTLEQLLNGVGDQQADAATQTQLLEDLRNTFGLNTDVLSPAALRSADGSASTANAAKLEKLRQIVDTFFEKAVAQTPDEAVAHLPSGLMQAFKDNLETLKPAIVNLFNAADAAAAQAKAGQEIILPNAAVLAVEKALAPVVQAQVAILQNLKKHAKDIPPGAVEDAAYKIENGGDLKDLHPALAAALRFVTPIGNNEGQGQGGEQNPREQQSILKQTAARFTSLAQRFESDPASPNPEITQGRFTNAEISPSFSSINIDTADIGCLTYWIMMMVANSATEDLREVMKELKANIDAKKVQREKMQLMKENQARIGTDMRNEYDQLVGEGVIKPSYTFDQYQAWRTIEYSDDGRAQLSVLNYGDLPKLATEGPPKEAADQQIVGGETPSVAGVIPLAPEDAALYADQYGVHVSDIQYIYAHFMSDPKLKDGDFDAYLKSGGGLKDAGDPPDPAIVAANGKAVENYFATLTNTGSAADKKLAADALKEAEKARGVDGPTSDANLQQMKDTISKMEVLKALQKAGVNVGSQLDLLQTELTQILKRPLTKADEDALKKWKDGPVTEPGTLAANLQQLGTYISKVYGFLEGDVRANIRDHVQGEMRNENDGDDYVDYTSYGIDKDGAYATARYYEYDDSNSAGDVTFRKDSSSFGYDAGYESVTMTATWPDPATGGPLVALMGQALAQAGNAKVPGDKLQGFASSLAVGASGSSGAAYSYAGPGFDDAGKPPPAVKTSTESDLAKGWKAQHQADLLHDKAEAKRKAAAEKKAAEMATKNEAVANGVGGQTKNQRVELDENGIDAKGNQWRMGSSAEYSAAIESEKGKLDSLSDLSEPMSMRLQQYMDRRAKALEALSNLMKKMSQTAETIVGNMK